MVNLTSKKYGYLAVIMLLLVSGCKNNPPLISHNFDSDTIVVNHGTILDFDFRFIDDKAELDSATLALEVRRYMLVLILSSYLRSTPGNCLPVHTHSGFLQATGKKSQIISICLLKLTL